MSIKDHRGGAEAVVVGVGCVMERSFKIFVFGKVLGGVVVEPGVRVAQEPRNPWLQESCLSHGESRRQQVGHDWPDVEDRPTLDAVGVGTDFSF